MTDMLQPNLIAAVDFTKGALIKNEILHDTLTLTGGQFNKGLLLDDTTTKAEGVASSKMSVPWPITISCVVRRLGNTSDNNSNIFGVVANKTDTGPYACYSLYAQPTTSLRFLGNAAGEFFFTETAMSTPLNVWQVITCEQRNDGFTLWQDTNITYTNSTSRLNPVVTGSSIIVAGSYTGTSRNCNYEIATAYIWNGAVGNLAANALIKDWYAPLRRTKRRLPAYVAAGGGFKAAWASQRTQIIGGGSR